MVVSYPEGGNEPDRRHTVQRAVLRLLMCDHDAPVGGHLPGG